MRMLIRTFGFANVALWAVAAAPAAAGPVQEPEEPRPQEQIEEEIQVTEVLLDVLVTDRRGNVVLGLGEDDFVVEEDGEPVELTDVTFYSNRRFLESTERAEALGIDAAQVPTERYFILFFHDQRNALPRVTAQLLDAGRRARQWVESELLPTDHVAVVGYDYDLDLFQDFTTDEEAILQAIGRAVRGVEPEPWPSRRQPAEGPSLLDAALSPREVADITERIYGAMQLIAKGAEDIPGRKNLILFSLGFGEVGTFGFYTPDSRYYRPMVNDLNDANVAVYAIDLISVEAGGALRDNIFGNSLSQLASDTGGRYYFNFVNFLAPLEQIAQDNSGYYLLAYRSPHPQGESGYQEVRVETANPEFRVRAREGYEWGEDEGGSAERGRR